MGLIKVSSYSQLLTFQSAPVGDLSACKGCIQKGAYKGCTQRVHTKGGIEEGAYKGCMQRVHAKGAYKEISSSFPTCQNSPNSPT